MKLIRKCDAVNKVFGGVVVSIFPDGSVKFDIPQVERGKKLPDAQKTLFLLEHQVKDLKMAIDYVKNEMKK